MVAPLTLLLALAAIVVTASDARAGVWFDAPFLDFDVHADPREVTVGDFDSDGRLDVATANRGSNDFTILFSNGDRTFGRRVDHPTGRGPRTIAAGDVNGDGRTDIVLATPDWRSISIHYGSGDGSFAPRETLAVSQTVKLALADLDRNGRQDILALTGSNILVVRLSMPTGFVSGGSPTLGIDGMVVADFSGDGELDVATVDQWNDAVRLAYGCCGGALMGGGPFYPTGQRPNGIAAGDVDGDGILDLVTTDFASQGISFLKGSGTGAFSPAIPTPTPNMGVSSPALIDLDRDGRLDLMIGAAVRMMGRGDGTFGPPEQLPGLGGDAVTADLDADGILDQAHPNLDAVTVHYGDGRGGFGTQHTYPTGELPTSIAIADFDRDDRIDLAVAAFNCGEFEDASAAKVLSAVAGGGFGPPLELCATGVTFGIAAADFDHNLWPDLVTANRDWDNASVFLHQADGAFAPAFSLATGGGPRDVVTDDFDSDGHTDVAIANSTSSTVTLWFGDGVGGFERRLDLATGLRPYNLTSGRLGDDPHPDLVTANYLGSTVTVLHNPGPGASWTRQDFAVDANPVDVAIGDLDSNGIADVATANAAHGTVSVLRGTKSGDLAFRADILAGPAVASIEIADLNLDGKPDIAVANDAFTGTLSILAGRGDGSFEPRVGYGVAFQPFDFAVADVDLDGSPDLISVHPYVDVVTVLRGLAKTVSVPLAGSSAANASLGAAYPNPSRGRISLPFSLARAGAVRLRVFDVAGRTVATLVDGERPAGTHVATWAYEQGLAAGIYFAELRALDVQVRRRVAIVR